MKKARHISELDNSNKIGNLPCVVITASGRKSPIHQTNNKASPLKSKSEQSLLQTKKTEKKNVFAPVSILNQASKKKKIVKTVRFDIKELPRERNAPENDESKKEEPTLPIVRISKASKKKKNYVQRNKGKLKKHVQPSSDKTHNFAREYTSSCHKSLFSVSLK